MVGVPMHKAERISCSDPNLSGAQTHNFEVIKHIRYGEGLTLGEVGAALGMSRFAAARALSAALEALRADLDVQGEKGREV